MARAPHPLDDLTRRPLQAAVSLGRQMQREWRAGPLHQLAISRPGTDGLAIRPRDLRPADPRAGERVLAGDFRFGGERLEVGPGGDPWRRALPSRRFAAALHGFGWMRDLIAAGEGGPREALRLWLEWRAVYGRYNAFAWSGEVLERRVFHLVTCAAALGPLVSDAEGAMFVANLARQARHLLGEPEGPDRAAERAAVVALVGASLSDKVGDGLRARATRRLERLLPLAVLRDGVHASRSPERGLELLFDLLALDDALSQFGAPAPVEVSRAVDRLSGRGSSRWPTAGCRASRAAKPALANGWPPRSPSTPRTIRRRNPRRTAAITGWRAGAYRSSPTPARSVGRRRACSRARSRWSAMATA
jgi:uncharacterized heparinase superfamily protein